MEQCIEQRVEKEMWDLDEEIENKAISLLINPDSQSEDSSSSESES